MKGGRSGKERASIRYLCPSVEVRAEPTKLRARWREQPCNVGDITNIINKGEEGEDERSETKKLHDRGSRSESENKMQETDKNLEERFLSVQELERVALKGDISAVVQRLGSARDLGCVEFLVLVWRECRVHVRDQCRDRQRVRGGIRRAEEVNDRVACET